MENCIFFVLSADIPFALTQSIVYMGSNHFYFIIRYCVQSIVANLEMVMPSKYASGESVRQIETGKKKGDEERFQSRSRTAITNCCPNVRKIYANSNKCPPNLNWNCLHLT